MHTVALVVFDRISPFEMAVPCEVFGTDRSDMGLPNYRFVVCAAEEGLLRTDAGFGIVASHGLTELRHAQTVVIPGWRDVEEDPPAELVEALQRSYQSGARIVSLCSGDRAIRNTYFVHEEEKGRHRFGQAGRYVLGAHLNDLSSVSYV